MVQKVLLHQLNVVKSKSLVLNPVSSGEALVDNLVAHELARKSLEYLS